jgi:hypothetical protein
MGLFDIFDSIGREIDTEARTLGDELDRILRGEPKGIERFARLDEPTQIRILEDIRNYAKERLDENAIRDILRRRYNIDLHPDFIRRIKADFGLAERDIKGFLKKLGIGLGLAGGGLGLGYLLFHGGGGGGGGGGSPSSPLQGLPSSPLPQGLPSSPLLGGSPSSPYPSSPSPSSPLPGGSSGFLGLPWWVWIIIIVIIITIIAYVLYKHHKKKKSHGSSGGSK